MENPVKLSVAASINIYTFCSGFQVQEFCETKKHFKSKLFETDQNLKLESENKILVIL